MFIFPQVKNKPWIPWVYTWSWHHHEQYYQLERCKKFFNFSLNFTKLLLEISSGMPSSSKNSSIMQTAGSIWLEMAKFFNRHIFLLHAVLFHILVHVFPIHVNVMMFMFKFMFFLFTFMFLLKGDIRMG